MGDVKVRGKAKIGRPSIRSPEMAQEFCSRIASGRSVASVCRDDDMPSDFTVWKWLYEDEAFASLYTRAIQARAMAHADTIDDLSERVVSGELPPDAARVAIDAKKWVASRLLPRVYGDKQTVEATVTHTHTLHLEALKELATRRSGTNIGYNETQRIENASNPTFSGERHGRDPVTIDVVPVPVEPDPPGTKPLDPPGSPEGEGAAAGAGASPRTHKKPSRQSHKKPPRPRPTPRPAGRDDQRASGKKKSGVAQGDQPPPVQEEPRGLS